MTQVRCAKTVRAISQQGKSVFIEFVSTRNRQICHRSKARAKTKKAANGKRSEMKNLPHGDKNIKFPFLGYATMHVAIVLPPCNMIGIDSSNMV